MRANTVKRGGGTVAYLFQLPPSHEGERELFKAGKNENVISTPALA